MQPFCSLFGSYTGKVVYRSIIRVDNIRLFFFSFTIKNKYIMSKKHISGQLAHSLANRDMKLEGMLILSEKKVINELPKAEPITVRNPVIVWA
jgi:hypothetical protein